MQAVSTTARSHLQAHQGIEHAGRQSLVKGRADASQQAAADEVEKSLGGEQDARDDAEAKQSRHASDGNEASAPGATEIQVPAHTRARGKRKPIDASLPRVRVEHDIAEDKKTCACGCRLTRIGEVTSEQFDLVPARAHVLSHVRFKYACRSCDGARATIARPW